MTEFLTSSQLKRLAEHKYSAYGVSICDPFMQKFWRWLVEQIPLWWAPNAITLVGLIINVVTTLILMYYSSDGKGEPPCWAFVLAATGLFIYQSLDAIDGKQARRTGSATPLGELFDHGCDSVSSVFVVAGTCIGLQLGQEPAWLFFECFATMFLFFLAHWQTYCSGGLKFGLIDVTEAQFSVITIYLISGFFGASVWSAELPVLGCQLKMLALWFSVFSAVLACHMNFGIIFVQGGVGKHGSTVAGTSVLSPIFPIGLLLALGYAVMVQSPTHLYHNHPILYVMAFGMASAKITNKLVVAHMTKSEMDLLDSSLLGPALLVANQYFNTVVNEYLVLWICFFYCTADLLWYSVQVTITICDYLNIFCFKITPTAPAATAGKGEGLAKSGAAKISGTKSTTHSPAAAEKASNDAQHGTAATNGVDYVRPVTRASSRLGGKRN